MAVVDPYVIRIPRQFLNDPEMRAWFEYDNRWKHDIWKRTGGGEDLVQESASNQQNLPIDQLRNQIKQLSSRIEELEAKPEIIPNTTKLEDQINDLRMSIVQTHISMREFRTIEASEAFTAVDRDFIKASTSEVISLPLFPPENAIIIAINGHTSDINIDGNGRTVNGSDSIKSVERNTFLTFYYFLATNEWFMTVATVEDKEHKAVLISEQENINASLKAVIFCLETIASIDHGSAIDIIEE